MPTINETLGQYSDLFMLLAAMVYAVAFICFAFDLAKSNETIRELEKNLVTEEQRELASVGAGAAVRRGSSRRGADAGDSDVLVGDSMDYDGAAPKRRFANIAITLTILAAIIHVAAVISRGIAAARVPWGNMYEFLSTGAAIVAVVYLIALRKKDLRFMGAFVVGLVTLMLCAATIGFPTPVAHLIPALQSPWLVIHVSIAVLSSALFTISFAMSALQLVQHYRQKNLVAGKKDRFPFLRLVPTAVALENAAYRINTIGFVMWTFTVMAGAIWAEAAWGRYWGWDVKEVWSFVTWTVYAGYLHARATRGWTGVRSAWLSIIGWACLVFNFTVVNLYFNGLHSYAGV
ncbi:cytochrome c-type biogenesis protein CcsB [Neomicrococcus aestuarii]|uniref:Cytochrome c-type biogenesis protein CcsB n=1 Tax=Neomicrococcus aestuarii TaxID=556325 RepID=A0A7W8TV45_9MICC|nr:c-type cytochrome biogenesis protein CcsB [Neomicrococcus aestuarii]MBB5513353.1 cytochrome c-type biogenesis protein CcsB [Neomicrococcus aestuarii]